MLADGGSLFPCAYADLASSKKTVAAESRNFELEIEYFAIEGEQIVCLHVKGKGLGWRVVLIQIFADRVQNVLAGLERDIVYPAGMQMGFGFDVATVDQILETDVLDGMKSCALIICMVDGLNE